MLQPHITMSDYFQVWARCIMILDEVRWRNKLV